MCHHLGNLGNNTLSLAGFGRKKTPTLKPWDNSEMSHSKSQGVLKTLVNSEKSGKISPVLKAVGPPLKVSRSCPVSGKSEWDLGIKSF